MRLKPGLYRFFNRILPVILYGPLLIVFVTPMAPTQAANRFPRPEFQTPYQQPHTLFPGARSELMQYADTALLILALGLAAWLALRKRSRNGLLLLTIACTAYFGFYRKGCVCPVGSIQNVTLALSDASFALPLTIGLFFGIPLLAALFFGRIFCSSVCPLGALQDLVAFKPLKIPPWLSSALGFFPHVYLGCAVLFAATGAGFLICKYDPFVGFFRLSGPPLMIAGGAALLLTGIFFVRPYCRVLCPYGALLGWMSALSGRHVTVTPDTCVNCRLCEDACPVGAIVPPALSEPREPRNIRIHRLLLHGALLPVWIVLGVFAGWQAGGPLSLAHPQVRCANQLIMEEQGNTGGLTLETKTARMGVVPVADLIAESRAIKRRMKQGGMALGGYLGMVIGCGIAGQGLRKRRSEYAIDNMRCVSCGRCFSSCPREHVRREQTTKGPTREA